MVNLLHTLPEAIVSQSMISHRDRKAHYCTECLRNKEFVYFLVILDAWLVFHSAAWDPFESSAAVIYIEELVKVFLNINTWLKPICRHNSSKWSPSEAGRLYTHNVISLLTFIMNFLLLTLYLTSCILSVAAAVFHFSSADEYIEKKSSLQLTEYWGLLAVLTSEMKAQKWCWHLKQRSSTLTHHNQPQILHTASLFHAILFFDIL